MPLTGHSESAVQLCANSVTVIGGKERMGVERIGSLDFPRLLNLLKFPRYRKNHATDFFNQCQEDAR